MFSDLPLATKPLSSDPVQHQQSFNRSMFQAISVQSMQKHYDVSSAFNPADMIAVNFLIQAVIADSKGFPLLSYAELEERKRDLDIDRSRLLDLQHKLKVESKMKEAALSLSKYHIPGPQAPESSAKRLSKQAFGEADLSFEKLAVLQAEYDDLTQRVHASETEILRSSVAVLALTHPGSNSSVAADYLTLEQTAAGKRETERSPIITGQPLPGQAASSRDITTSNKSNPIDEENVRDVVPDLSRGMSKRSVSSLSVKPGLSRGLSIRSNLVSETYEDEKLESLILTVSSVLPVRESPGPLPSTRKKLEHLEEITRALVREYVTKEDERSLVDNMEAETRNREVEELQRQVDALTAELETSRAAEHEWRERTSEVKAELERVLGSLEGLTQQSVEYEAERGRMEAKISELERELMSSSKMSTLDNSSVSTLGASSSSASGETPLSVMILRNDFKKMVEELNLKHSEIVSKEQNERRRLEELLGGGPAGANKGGNQIVNVM
ncbi:hypothetical protein D0Z00_001087 [Geotrichum galactomycetum]|uniref:Uncharacterized protein n=1 Tax=Geotrichum galactomycetum TaxID=27317 RepID=A0ACB6V855_9ASCO|nr:hypothetical protein D0Z00_001087 [Geotrichum candidum]